MAAQDTIHVSEELLAELRSRAEREGKLLNQVAEELLRRGLDDIAWQQLLEYGRQTGEASGYTEADVPEIVRRRREIRRRLQ